MSTPEPGRLQKASLAGSAACLLTTIVLGVFWFTALVSLSALGVSTLIVWIGVPICMFAVLLWRGGANLERARVYALLNTWIAVPYRALPDATKQRWKTRFTDAATWRDYVYLLLLLPLGIAEFVLVTVFWAVSLGHIALPIFFRWLPEGSYYFPAWEVRWITVDSTLDALPWCALGLLLLAITIPLTRALGTLHARIALALLGPTRRRSAELNATADDAPLSAAVAR